MSQLIERMNESDFESFSVDGKDLNRFLPDPLNTFIKDKKIVLLSNEYQELLIEYLNRNEIFKDLITKVDDKNREEFYIILPFKSKSETFYLLFKVNTIKQEITSTIFK
ncbi:predicted protein [Naegleria gruberi]|uniref:Predicted protein n=1 Tax=Naegleria gruberi TaxID=5762 RepID=D2W0E6_NAEGR|nr:uncharacterized protein NAEGRDRAFT_74831 [Naegleria gruberi]EFC37461.1 predicted protein [Naegleria gruberi]|eukprot:XP_002670205.1 predicted protein [Naegleria gruberi strain NEG-M]